MNPIDLDIGIIVKLGVLGIAIVTWLIRLESKVISIDKELLQIIDGFEKDVGRFQGKIEKLHNDLTEIKLALVRIESRIFESRSNKHNGGFDGSN